MYSTSTVAHPLQALLPPLRIVQLSLQLADVLPLPISVARRARQLALQLCHALVRLRVTKGRPR